jgi:hypothetical protein
VLLSISEACRILHINPQTLRRWENAGKLKCVWTEGGQRRVALEEVARILGCDPEDVEVEPQGKGSIDLRKKRMEVEAMRLDLRKEKAARALSRVKGDSVRKARDELEILRIEKEKERLLATEREAEAEREYAKHRERCLEAWVQFSYKCLDIVSYIAPSLVKEPERIPLELKVKVKKAVMEFLSDLEIDKDIDAIKLQVEKIAHRVRADFYKPKWKGDMVEYVISWLSKTWPFWLDKRAARMLEGAFRQVLEQRLTGLEDFEDVDKEVERLRDEALSEIRRAQGEERQRVIEGFVKTIKEAALLIKFDRL